MQSLEFHLKDISVKRIVISIARLKLLSFIFLCTVHFPTIHWHLGRHIGSRIFNESHEGNFDFHFLFC